MIKLSDRLQVIADEIEQGETVADIGTDHGLLPIFLYESGRSPRVILCDINRGPLEKAGANIAMYLGEEVPGGLSKGNLELRLGSGLKPLRSAETDAVVIAGMGGILITEILGEDLNHSRSFSRLVLQPRNKSHILRRWLFQNGFVITAEHLVVERKYICEVITARPKDKGNAGSDGEASPEFDPDLDLEISPLLYRSRDPLLIPFLENKIRIEENIVRFVAEGSGEGVDHRRIVQAKKRLSALRAKLAQAETLKGGKARSAAEALRPKAELLRSEAKASREGLQDGDKGGTNQ